MEIVRAGLRRPASKPPAMARKLHSPGCLERFYRRTDVSNRDFNRIQVYLAPGMLGSFAPDKKSALQRTSHLNGWHDTVVVIDRAIACLIFPVPIIVVAVFWRSLQLPLCNAGS